MGTYGCETSVVISYVCVCAMALPAHSVGKTRRVKEKPGEDIGIRRIGEIRERRQEGEKGGRRQQGKAG